MNKCHYKCRVLSKNGSGNTTARMCHRDVCAVHLSLWGVLKSIFSVLTAPIVFIIFDISNISQCVCYCDKNIVIVRAWVKWLLYRGWGDGWEWGLAIYSLLNKKNFYILSQIKRKGENGKTYCLQNLIFISVFIFLILLDSKTIKYTNKCFYKI